MSGADHHDIYAPLDPVAVAQIAIGWGIDAAYERWSPWSERAISIAAERGKRILKRSRSESQTRQTARSHGGIDPAVISRIVLAGDRGRADDIRSLAPARRHAPE